MTPRTALLSLALSLSLSLPAFAQTADKLDVTFIVTADTHITSESPLMAKNHVRSLAVMKTATEPRLTWPKGLIDEGKPIPQPAAVFIAGDLSYDGRLKTDKPEWEMFRRLYLDRTTSELKMPVYPGAGNHDTWMHINQYLLGTHDLVNWGVTALVKKSWEGSTVDAYSPALSTGWWHPPHYAVGIGDGRLLAVQLNTSIGEPCRSGTILGNQGRYLEPSDPQCDAFAWLRNVLAAHRARFGDAARVIIVQHYGYDGFGVGTNDYAYRGYWWAPEYRRQFAETIAPYRVIGFIHGHTHVPQFTTPGTMYSDLTFGTDLSSVALTAGDAKGRAWTNVINNQPEYCRVLSATGQIRCTSVGTAGVDWLSSTFDVGDEEGRAWINVESDIKPAKQYADYCRVLRGSNSIACNRRDGSGFIGDTAIRKLDDAGWKNSRVWVKLSPTVPAAFCRVTGTSGDTIRCTPYSNGAWGNDIVASGLDTGWPNTRTWVDFNNDGKIDFCRSIGNPNRVSCRVSDANGLFQKEVTSGTVDHGKDAGIGWADVNLDGYADFCRVTESDSANGRLLCLLTDGKGGFSTTEISSPWQGSGLGFDVGYGEGRTWADFNADKRADFCRVMENNSGSKGRIECTVTGAGAIGPSFRSLYVDPGETAGRAFLDVNGDGRADFCRVAGGRAVCTLAAVTTTTVPVPSFGVGSGFCNAPDGSVGGYTVFHVTDERIESVDVTKASSCDQATYDGTVVAGTTHSIPAK